MYYYDENGNIIDDRKTVLESLENDSDELELDIEDKMLLFEALMRDLLSTEEFHAYVESNEYGLDLIALFGDNELVTEAVRSKIKLSAFDEIKRLAKIAVYSIARKKGNIKFKRLERLQRKSRQLEAELAREYGPEAIRLARDQYRIAKKNVASKTAKNAVKKAEPKATKDFFRYTKKVK